MLASVTWSCLRGGAGECGQEGERAQFTQEGFVEDIASTFLDLLLS